MPVSHALKRLLRIRDLEQEQQRVALESALTELRTIESALSVAAERERSGRGEFTTGVRTGESLVRHSAVVETAIGGQHLAALSPALTRAEAEAARRRHAFLLKRMERRQVETLMQEAQAEETAEEARMSQQRVDDWYLARVLREEREDSAEPVAEEFSNAAQRKLPE